MLCLPSWSILRSPIPPDPMMLNGSPMGCWLRLPSIFRNGLLVLEFRGSGARSSKIRDIPRLSSLRFRALSIRLFYSTATLTNSLHSRDGMKILDLASQLSKMESSMGGAELTMDTLLMAQCWPLRRFRSRAFLCQDVWWSLKEMRRVEVGICLTTYRSSRIGLVPLKSPSALILEDLTTIVFGSPTL